MHIGLSHFTGRGLPTIWSFISSNEIDRSPRPPYEFTDTDSKVIRDWARQLDDWLVQYYSKSLPMSSCTKLTLSKEPNDPEHDSLMIFRQYNLHRLFVLSIYHPARGFDLFANNVASVERHELLVSARATLRLHNDDKSIWSNWDLVMITWGALLVLQGVEGGVGEPDGKFLLDEGSSFLTSIQTSSSSKRT